jgi:glycosyltransferase involved in cell wall biosynthesis
MTAGDFVSIIIPTYYRNDWLRSAIESALDQTYEPIEVIVVDDSGERHAEAVAREYDVTYIAHEENQGGNPARNTGIEAARGGYIQLLDDDDQLLPEKVEKQVSFLRANPSVGVVYCGLREENGETILPREGNRGDVLAQALGIDDLHPCQTVTMLFRGEILRELHPLATRAAGDDLGLKIRLAARTEFDFLDEVLVLKGDPEVHRVDRLAFTDEVLSMIVEFDHLYTRFDDRVRKDAMVVAYESKGYRLLGRHWWSLEAILCFGRALYYSESPDPTLAAAFVSSLFGRPMYLVVREVHSRMSRRSGRPE